jgi:tetratricopeptide (TPR) repeat protein
MPAQNASRDQAAETEASYQAELAAAPDDLARARIGNKLAVLYQAQDRYPDAERTFRTVLQWRQKSLPVGSIEIAYSLNNLGEIYRVQGHYWEARKLMENAVHSLQQSHADAAGLPILLGNLAIVLCHFREFDKAEELLRKSLNYYQRQAVESREYGVMVDNLAQILQMKKELDAAAPLYEQAIGILERVGVPARLELASALSNAGILFQRLNRIQDSRKAEQRALDLLPPSGEKVLRSEILWNLGNVELSAGGAADSLPYFEQSLAIQEQTFGADYPATAQLLLDYSVATQRAGNKSLSRKLHKRAMDLLARLNQAPEQMTVSVKALLPRK